MCGCWLSEGVVDSSGRRRPESRTVVTGLVRLPRVSALPPNHLLSDSPRSSELPDAHDDHLVAIRVLYLGQACLLFIAGGRSPGHGVCHVSRASHTSG